MAAYAPHSDGLPRAYSSSARYIAEKPYNPSVTPYGYAIFCGTVSTPKTVYLEGAFRLNRDNNLTQERDFLPRLKSRVSIPSIL